MSDYDALWRMFTWEAKDGLGRAFLKEYAEEVSERLLESAYVHADDLVRDEAVEGSVLCLLRDCMTDEQWDEFNGNDAPSCPECDDAGAWVRELARYSNTELRRRGMTDEDIRHIRELSRHLEPHCRRGDRA